MAQDWFNALLGPYFERQGKIAQESSAFADAGAKSFREQGNPLGLGQMALGAAGWLGSPIGALVPHGIEQNSIVPDAFKPAVKGALDFTDYFMPGPNEFMAPAQAIGIGLSGLKAPLRTLPDFTANEDALMAKANSPEEQRQIAIALRDAFGWERPYADQSLIHNISDKNVRMQPRALEQLGNKAAEAETTGLRTRVNGPLSFFLSADEIFGNYPDLAHTPTAVVMSKKTKYGEPNFATEATFNPNGATSITAEPSTNFDVNELVSALLHETGHGVQLKSGRIGAHNVIPPTGLISRLKQQQPALSREQREELARLGYLRSVNEVEARNTQGQYLHDITQGLVDFAAIDPVYPAYLGQNFTGGRPLLADTASVPRHLQIPRIDFADVASMFPDIFARPAK